MKLTVRALVPVACSLLAASVLTGSSTASPAPDESKPPVAADRGYAPPRHDLLDSNARYNAHYEYAGSGQNYRKSHRPKGLTAKFTVHKPKHGKWHKGDHSLAEMALVRPGSSRKRPTYIETGWIRGIGDGKVRLFVFWWGLKGGPHCYNLACKGFVDKGKGIRPGAVLKPGTKIKLGWVHKHNRWNLYVNGKRSGYYPDRLWKNKFESFSTAQVFGEVVYGGRGGRCIDMGTGKFPKRHKGARVWDMKLHGTRTKANFQKWNETKPKRYKFKRTSRKAFRYGGPGPC